MRKLNRPPRRGRAAHSGLLLLALLLLTGGPLLAAQAHEPTQEQERAPGVQTLTYGSSVQGQPLEGLRLGTGPRSVVITGAIHGSEGNSAVLARALQTHMQANMHLLPPDVSLYFLPVLNPDGLAVGSRYNANGVDLNRNWDTANWQPDSYDSSGRVVGGGGSAPFSEPETAALAGWLLNLRAQSSSVTTVFYHSAVPPRGLVLDGSVGRVVAHAYADVLGYAKTGGGGGGWSAYPVTGAAPIWCGSADMACFEVELPSKANLTPAQTERHITALLGVLLHEQYAPGQRCFAATGMCIAGRLRAFWQQHDGLRAFGLPLTRQQEQLIDGVPRQVQLFERARLELHPEQPAPNDVQLGRLGVERLEQQGRSWWVFPPGTPSEGCRFFAATQQALCAPFLAAWQTNGLDTDGQPGSNENESLARFGLPISPAQTETLPDGREYTVQWFERARLELPTDPAAAPQVQVGLLGRELLNAAEPEGR